MRFKNLKTLKVDSRGKPIWYEYKGFLIWKNGYSSYPYNIYSIYDNLDGVHLGFGKTVIECVHTIDDCEDDFREQAEKYAYGRDYMKRWRAREFGE